MDPSCRIAFKAVPNASRSEVVGWVGDAVKVKVQSPPVDGRANEELIRFLAEALGVKRSALRLAAGASSRLKQVEVSGLSRDAALRRLGLAKAST